MLRPPDRNPTFETRDTKRGIQLPQMFDGDPRLLRSVGERVTCRDDGNDSQEGWRFPERLLCPRGGRVKAPRKQDRKSTRLNSSHQIISYAVFCLKKKKKLRHTSLAV